MYFISTFWYFLGIFTMLFAISLVIYLLFALNSNKLAHMRLTQCVFAFGLELQVFSIQQALL